MRRRWLTGLSSGSQAETDRRPRWPALSRPPFTPGLASARSSRGLKASTTQCWAARKAFALRRQYLVSLARSGPSRARLSRKRPAHQRGFPVPLTSVHWCHRQLRLRHLQPRRRRHIGPFHSRCTRTLASMALSRREEPGHRRSNPASSRAHGSRMETSRVENGLGVYQQTKACKDHPRGLPSKGDVAGELREAGLGHRGRRRARGSLW